ncbi:MULTISPECIES: energy-coupling factor ABC transporter substrate-binding protein [Halobacterium]|uniref:energy-coupling factor ABC transporter substrate-binding protein n=1 Tax=Halobacterium TaxID=2239 RepID=UPI00196260D5|nr:MULTISPECIES: energy-coupling factor ABC transporter substrate-binding protein [Halobacterium]MCF2165941.1 energy-coupling factor ABC transporter substrate-binding protein [Halobacterium salinarum]MCF2167460.1 energy-coupling factor ABC transporter substrate-binding protein [Halobacterium salinarum]MCF2238849.1 energy-coupling factor ABC transporter substrate-binding protein [Halobacterium salinarum]MDL0127888.1 energy-coupling factor ABC transporter substrate-binding protein [Halobacterium 
MNRWLAAGGILLGALVVFSFVSAGAWGGTDGVANDTITTINPSYEPWFQSLWTPPSGEIESLLFSIQAAVGGIIIGYYLGRDRPRGQSQDMGSDLP